MKLLNIMETIVLSLFTDCEKTYTPKCGCDVCKSDIMALALNKLPQKYASTDKGEVLIKALYTDNQMKQDVIKEITLAMIQVEQNPRHKLSN